MAAFGSVASRKRNSKRVTPPWPMMACAFSCCATKRRQSNGPSGGYCRSCTGHTCSRALFNSARAFFFHYRLALVVRDVRHGEHRLQVRWASTGLLRQRRRRLFGLRRRQRWLPRRLLCWLLRRRLLCWLLRRLLWQRLLYLLRQRRRRLCWLRRRRWLQRRRLFWLRRRLLLLLLLWQWMLCLLNWRRLC